jgi:hypothetical protein
VTNRRNLVVLRAGPTSLHPGLLDLPYEQRDFDLVLSFYDEVAFAAFRPEAGVSAVLVPGGKWNGLHKTLIDLDLEGRDYIWLPDDDIATSAQDVNRLFALCQHYGLAVAQPALSGDSYFSHPLFLRCAGFRLRYTNYIEVMVPCLSRKVLQKALPLFADTASGFGLDYIWCRWPETGAFRAAVLDEVAVRHTRPVGRVLREAIAVRGGPSSEAEEAHLRAAFGLKQRIVPITFAGVLVDGTPVLGRFAMALEMWRSWRCDPIKSPEPMKYFWGLWKVLRRQVLKRLKMRNLSVRTEVLSHSKGDA